MRNAQKLARCMHFESIQAWGSKVSFELPAITLKDDRIKLPHSQRHGFSFNLRYWGTAHQGELIRHAYLAKMQFPSKADTFLKVHDLLRFSFEEANLGPRSQPGQAPAQMAGLLPHSAGGSGVTGRFCKAKTLLNLHCASHSISLYCSWKSYPWEELIDLAED